MEKLHKDINSIEDLKSVIEFYGGHFEKEGSGYKTKCIFHNEKTSSLVIKDKGQGAFFKCYGCGESGDIINIVMKKEGLSYIESVKKAHEILGRSLDIQQPTKIDKLTNFIRKSKNIEGYDIEDIYLYKNDKDIPVICKIKYRNSEQNKDMRTYKVIDKDDYYTLVTTKNNGEYEYTIYNYPRVKYAIENNHNVYFVEGEKDANNLNRLGFAATTIYSKKWVEEYSKQLTGSKIVFIGDTGKAGEEFKKLVWENLKDIAKSFKIVTLPGLENLGDNKDVSDWLETGKTKDDLLNAVKRSLDLKNENELQQDDLGIYKTIIKETEEGIIEKKIYITNFNIEKVKILRNKDNKDQIIDITVKSNLGTFETIEANARELFLDVKTFNRNMGVDYTFKSKIDDLIRLKEWILRYFIDEDIEEYIITGIREIKGQDVLVTNNGILDKEGNWNTKIKARNTIHDIDFSDVSLLTETEARTLANNLFVFNSKENIVNTIGLGVANLYNYYARQSRKDNVPILQNVGESNSGKSKTLNLLNLLFNNMKQSRSFKDCSAFVLTKLFNETYLPIFVDEMKPSKAGVYKTNGWSNHIRGITEGYEIEKGKKDQTLIKYKYNASLILSGEEQIIETAITNRSNIVWYSQKNFTHEGETAVDYLVKNNEGIKLLRSFSKSLYLEVLNQGLEGFEIQYDICKAKIGNRINNDRVKNTATYTLIGYRLLLDVFSNFNVDIEKYITESEAIDLIVENLKENVLDSEVAGGKAEYETILELIDKIDIIKDVHYKYTRDKSYIQIDINGIWDKLTKYIKDYNVNINLLPKETFIKMLIKSQYIYGDTSKEYYVTLKLKDQFTSKLKTKRVYKLKVEELEKLYMPNLAPAKEEFEEVEGIIPFK